MNKKIKKSASYAEMNQLLVEKEVFQKGYKRFFQKVIDISQHGFNQLSVLCQCTSEVYKVSAHVIPRKCRKAITHITISVFLFNIYYLSQNEGVECGAGQM